MCCTWISCDSILVNQSIMISCEFSEDFGIPFRLWIQPQTNTWTDVFLFISTISLKSADSILLSVSIFHPCSAIYSSSLIHTFCASIRPYVYLRSRSHSRSKYITRIWLHNHCRTSSIIKTRKKITHISSSLSLSHT